MKFKIGDRVRVRDVLDDKWYYRYKDFIDGEGFIICLHDRKDYPYEIEFIDKRLQRQCDREGGLLWKEKELEAI